MDVTQVLSHCRTAFETSLYLGGNVSMAKQTRNQRRKFLRAFGFHVFYVDGRVLTPKGYRGGLHLPVL